MSVIYAESRIELENNRHLSESTYANREQGFCHMSSTQTSFLLGYNLRFSSFNLSIQFASFTNRTNQTSAPVTRTRHCWSAPNCPQTSAGDAREIVTSLVCQTSQIIWRNGRVRRTVWAPPKAFKSFEWGTQGSCTALLLWWLSGNQF